MSTRPLHAAGGTVIWGTRVTSSGPLRRQLDQALAENQALRAKLAAPRQVILCNPRLPSTESPSVHRYEPVLRCSACGRIAYHNAEAPCLVT